ncbi:polysaccharide deacetylase family protein, partial [Bacillus sp. MHSD17]|nr:polysaccharide deacetylase family protein [Bacillus sp. MHSD17]
PGDVILFHDGGGDRSQTIKALEEILPVLKKQGYTFVTISELIESKQQKEQVQ